MVSIRVFSGLIAAFSPLAVLAQSTFIVTPSQVTGIRLLGPETPEFTASLSTLDVGPKPGGAASTILSRAVIVSNTTNRPITKFVVRFDYLNPQGKMSAQVQWLEPREPFEPGTARLITVSKTLTEAVRLEWPDETLLRASGPRSSGIINSPFIRVSLDSVLFADGDFVGPDVSACLAMLEEEYEFVRATRVDLERSGTNVDEIRRKLEAIYKPIVDGKKSPGEGLRVTMMREMLYGSLTYQLKKGFEAFRAELEARFGERPLRRTF